MKKEYLIILFSFINLVSYGQCPPNDIELLTQQEVDDFAINYPNCTELSHGLFIGDPWNNEINNVNGLSPITSIGGDLDLYSNSLVNISGLSSLTNIGEDFNLNGVLLSNLSGLENLQTIGGNFWISCDNIINVNELSNLQSIGGDLVLWLMDAIQDISGLSNIQSVDRLRIIHCTNLQSLNGLENIHTINEELSLRGLDDLQDTDLSVFNNLNSVESIELDNMPNLQSLAGLGNITAIDYLRIEYMPSLQSLSGLENLQIINDSFFGWALNINSCPLLENITDLSNLQSITGEIIFSNLPNLLSLSPLSNTTINCEEDLRISSCTSLTSLGGLENLFFDSSYRSVFIENNANLNDVSQLEGVVKAKILRINNNDALTNLTGLENVLEIDYELEIKDNNQLSSIYGLSNLQAFGINSITVTGNPELSECDIMAICGNLNNWNIDRIFNNNASGCSSLEEVAVACDIILSISESANLDLKVSLYPNPVKTTLYITSESTIEKVVIYAISGKIILEQNLMNNQFVDVSHLSNGMYFTEISSTSGKSIKKFIKN